MDLGAWWRDRRWMALLDLIEQMPTACRWREALANDADHARQAVEFEQDEADQWSPPWREYDLSALQLREVINLLTLIGQGLGVISGGDQFPAPATAFERARRERDLGVFAHITAQLLPRE